MKKIFALFLALSMMASLVACSSSGDTTTSSSASASSSASTAAVSIEDVDLQELAANYDGEITVSVWGTWSTEDSRGAWLVERGEEYVSQFDNVVFEYVGQGGYDDVNEKLTQGAAAGDMPTLVYVEEAVVPGYTALAFDLRDYMKADVLDNYMDGLMVSLTEDSGKVMAVPMSRSEVVMYINTTLLAEAGWEAEDVQTIDDMLACAEDVYNATGVPGFGLFWDSDCWVFESMCYAYGGAVLSDDGTEVVFGENGDYVGAEYLEAVKDGLIEGWISQTYTGAQPDSDLKVQFQAGEVAMMLFSNNNFTSYQSGAEENGYEVVLQVQPAGTEKSVASGGGNWMLTNTSSYEEAVLAGGWLSYIAQDENVLNWTETCGAMITTKTAFASDEAQAMFEENPNHLVVYETMDYLHKRVNSPYWTEMYTYMADKLYQYAMYPEDYDITTLIDDMATKCEQIIEDNNW